MTRTRQLLASLGLLPLLVATACGGSGGSSGSAGSGSSPDTNASGGGDKVMIVNYTFKPEKLTVPVGTTVVWTNNDSTVHTVTSTGDTKFDSGNMNKGKTYTMTFRTAGTYSYFCDIHQYMRGTIVVK